MWFSGLEQHYCRREQGEGEYQGHGEADAHDPAEIDHRPDAANYQRAKGHHGGDYHVKTGDELAANRLPHQITLLSIGILHMQLAVADDEMNGKGENEDQQQG